MTVRILWEVLQVGNLIASPRHTTVEDGEYARVTTEYAWWYRPVVAFAFWLCEMKHAVLSMLLSLTIYALRRLDVAYLALWHMTNKGVGDG